MDILFVTDYVCPYCLVLKEALDQTIAETGITPNITIHPFELTPEPTPQVDTWSDERRRAGYKVLEEPCKTLGLPMKLPPHIVPRPRTRLAFEGWYYACDHGKGDAWSDRMYRAYFIDELDIGNPDVLTAQAALLGMDAADFRQALDTGRYTAQEQSACTHAREELGIKGVPTIYVDGEMLDIRTYTKAYMISLLQGR